ncbi:conserved hypothetical protein [Uncinocarpus reesii 1704]|uniref:tRNA wybutosine-synthesizing protein 2 n=1 Tax=Uncinocarpus reesii (strain UAMH 1704) TaxID=336963 RepID=C4JRX7_UNCRE|nr:uncharacterized protein UREG_05216 [Uncinocarpus reesii 1704]EEP80374.1 conserved hypothetical protein [Uncinocarpus reesii 1704]
MEKPENLGKERVSFENLESRRAQRKLRIRMNPLQRGIEKFLSSYTPHLDLSECKDLISSLPKRYTIYPPLLLLPQNTFTANAQLEKLISSLSPEQSKALYTCIATAFSSQGVTHIAINAPIALTTGGSGNENRMRSPTGLIPLHGDFGPLPSDSEAEREENPTISDMQSAFWVRAVQNSGIVQIWAPLYSMFSRGNIIEKARVLGTASKFEGLTDVDLGQKLEDVAVVDMYAGIGYFVFSYLKRGVGRVWAWELNGWSIEGLERGCQANGWKVKSIRIDSLDQLNGLEELIEGLSDEDRVVAFHGDNRFAVDLLSQVLGRERSVCWTRKTKGGFMCMKMLALTVSTNIGTLLFAKSSP